MIYLGATSTSFYTPNGTTRVLHQSSLLAKNLQLSSFWMQMPATEGMNDIPDSMCSLRLVFN